MKGCEYSIVIACLNEEQNAPILLDELKSVLNKTNKNYEVIFIDDGSTDRTFAKLEELHNKNKDIVKVIKLRKNFGQTFAWNVGFKYARGKYIITMDSDLQNDPNDITALIKKIEEGFDAVSGWRFIRKDDISKKMFSRIANFIRRVLVNETLHDSGCSLKIYKREVLEGIGLYGEMHRYITSLLILRGCKVGEVKVNHRPRKFGKTKYTSRRLFKGFMDLLFIKFWSDYSSRPLHFFGALAVIMIVFGIVIGTANIYYHLITRGLFGVQVGPILLVALLMILLGFQFIILGFLGEIIIRNYYANVDETKYKIEKILNE